MRVAVMPIPDVLYLTEDGWIHLEQILELIEYDREVPLPRLSHHDLEEIAEMGMEEQVEGDGVSLIEWSERAPEFVPSRALIVAIQTVDEETREITFEARSGFPFQEDTLL